MLYNISCSQSEEGTYDVEPEEGLSDIFKIISKKLIEHISVDELSRNSWGR